MDLGSLHNTVTRLKESMELITGQSRDQRYRSVFGGVDGNGQ
jgi:hypothetical protein